MIEFPITLTSSGSVCMPGYVFALALGYTKNLGVYRLHVDATGEWEGLTIRCFWHVPDGKDPSSSLVVDGYVDVPASVTAQPGSGCITFEGSDDTKNITSADLHYRVSANSGTEDGTEPEPGTPAWQQLVDAVHTDATAAEQAKTDAQTAAQQAGVSAKNAWQALSDTITAKEDALKATKAAQTAASEANASAENAALAQVTASQLAGQAAGSASEAQNSATKAAASQQTAESNAAAAQGSATKAEASASTAVQGQQRAEAAAARAETAQQQTESASTDALDKISSAKTDALKAIGNKQTSATTAVESAQGKALDAVADAKNTAVTAVTDAQTAATQAVGTVQANAIQQMKSTKTDALKAIGDKQTAATQAVDTARDKALQQVGASTEAAQTAANEATTSAGNADQSAQKAAGSLQELKNGIASGDFKGEPCKTGATPVLTIGTVSSGDKPSADITGTPENPVLNLILQPGPQGPAVALDTTLTHEGEAADAKATGDAISAVKARQNILIGTETGNPLSVDDAFPASLCGLTVYGCSTQDGTPTPDAPVPIVSAGDSGSVAVKVTGKNLLDFLHAEITKTGWNGKFTRDEEILTVSAVNGWNSYWFVSPVRGKQISVSFTYRQIDDKTGDTSQALALGTSAAPSYMRTDVYRVNSPKKSWTKVACTMISEAYVGMMLRVANESVNEERTIEIKDFQLELGSTATTYSPYREQLLTLPTPDGLPGIPVTSGGNYTDQSGQQWVCDEVDLERGVKVQRVDKSAFDSTKTLAEQNAILATPIETPLTPDEIAAYKALTAYGPDTVVQAGDGAGVKLEYQRDVNIAIKKLEDAVASMT